LFYSDLYNHITKEKIPMAKLIFVPMETCI